MDIVTSRNTTLTGVGQPSQLQETLIIEEYNSKNSVKTLPNKKIKSSKIKPRTLGYIRLGVYFVVLVLTASTYAGWPFIQFMLEKYGIYAWLCYNKNEPEGCDDQKSAIQFLYAISVVGNFTMNPVSAFLSQNIGPRKTAIIGALFLIIGYSSASLSSKRFDFYILAFYILGGTSDYLYFPAFSLMHTFPTMKSAISGLFLGAGCASWYVPAVQMFITEHTSFGFDEIYLAYALVAIPILIPLIILVPSIDPQQAQRITSKQYEQNIQKENVKDNIKETSFLQNTKMDENNNIEKVERVVYIEESTDLTTTSETSTTSQTKPSKSKLGSLLQIFRTHPVTHALLTPRHIFHLILFLIYIFRYVFYYSALSEFLGPDYGITLGYIAPLSFISSPIYGYLLDKVGFLIASSIFNTLNIIMVVSAMLAIHFENEILNWTSIILYPIAYGSYLFLLSFIIKSWGTIPNYLLIVGFDLICAAFASFATNLAFTLSLSLFNGNFQPALGFILGLSVICYPLILLSNRLKP